MKRFLRFLALAVIGFGLGAGAAWLGNHKNSTAPLPPISPAAQQAAKEAVKKASAVAPSVAIDSEGKIAISKDVGAVKGDGLTGQVSTPDTLTGIEGALGNETLTGEPSSASNAAADVAAVKTGIHKAATKPAKKTIPLIGTQPTGVGEGYFSLLDQNGNPVTEKSWPGKYLLVFFGFTHCPDICPVTLQKIGAVMEKLGDDAQKVQPLFITVDPARDTPDVLKAYLANFDKRILGLTGSEEQIKGAEDDFKVYAAKVPAKEGTDYQVNHSGFSYLMSPEGKMVALLKIEDTTEATFNKIKPQLAKLDTNTSAPRAPKLP